jgi:hypothetical protein
MSLPLCRIAYRKTDTNPAEILVDKEWLVTNGLGGYASGTLAGVITRGFHGYLVAALPTPLGRVMMLNDLIEKIALPDGTSIQLSGEERMNAPLRAHGSDYLQEFRLDDGNPVWTFQFGELLLEKRVLMVHRQNTVHISYQLKGPGSLKLSLRPSVNFRPHEAPVSTPLAGNYAFTVIEDSFEVSSQTNIPPLRLMLYGQQKSLTMDRTRIQEVVYRIEESRGYAAHGDLWSPGYFSVMLSANDSATLVASAESWDTIIRHRGGKNAAQALVGKGYGRSGYRPGRRVGISCGSIHYRAGRPRGRHNARARRGRRSAHSDCRLPVVHRLGPRHHDQPGRIDDGHRAPCGGRLHSANVCALHSQRADPQHVSGRPR